MDGRGRLSAGKGVIRRKRGVFHYKGGGRDSTLLQGGGGETDVIFSKNIDMSRT